MVLWRWNVSLTHGTPLFGVGSAKVLAPQPDHEQAAATFSPSDLEQAVERGAQDIMAMTKDQGRTISYDDAREQALAAIRYTFPEL